MRYVDGRLRCGVENTDWRQLLQMNFGSETMPD